MNKFTKAAVAALMLSSASGVMTASAEYGGPVPSYANVANVARLQAQIDSLGQRYQECQRQLYLKQIELQVERKARDEAVRCFEAVAHVQLRERAAHVNVLDGQISNLTGESYISGHMSNDVTVNLLLRLMGRTVERDARANVTLQEYENVLEMLKSTREDLENYKIYWRQVSDLCSVMQKSFYESEARSKQQIDSLSAQLNNASEERDAASRRAESFRQTLRAYTTKTRSKTTTSSITRSRAKIKTGKLASRLKNNT